MNRAAGKLVIFGLMTLPGPGGPERLAVVDGLSGPEAVSYDTAQGVYFVSNVNGTVGVKDARAGS
jgi:hypothetical protein